MFGCIVAGRAVQTNLQQVDATKFLFELPDPTSIHHLVVFLLHPVPTGAAAANVGGSLLPPTLPEGYGASIHLLYPGPPGTSWQPLGYVSQDKPSAIFRVHGSGSSSSRRAAGGEEADSSMDLMDPDGPGDALPARLGISMEPLSTVYAQFPLGLRTGAEPASAAGTGAGSSMMVMSEDTSPSGAMVLASSPAALPASTLMTMATRLVTHLYHHCLSFAVGEMLPIKALQDWMGSVTAKIKHDPASFLRPPEGEAGGA